MTSTNIALTAITDSNAGLVVFEDLHAALAVLVKKVQITERLNVRVDRRFLALDLENVAKSVQELAAFLEAGLGQEALNATKDHTLTLVRDMIARADSAIADRVQSVTIHAEVAAMRANPNEPFDVTAQMNLVAAAPQPAHSDAPGTLVAVAPLAKMEMDKAYGRVSGAHYSLRVIDTLHSAPMTATILPVGSVVRFQKGDIFGLYTQGQQAGGANNIPTASDRAVCVLIEAAQDDLIVHGPAVLGMIETPKNMLSNMHALQEVTMEFFDKETAMGSKILYGVGVFFSLASIPSLLEFGMNAVPLTIMTASGLVALARFSYIKSNMRNLLKRLQTFSAKTLATNYIDCLNTIHANHAPDATPLFNQTDTEYGLVNAASCENAMYLSKGHALNALNNPEHNFSLSTTGLNAFPATHIQALSVESVRVMTPLLALPAPVAETVLQDRAPTLEKRSA